MGGNSLELEVSSTINIFPKTREDRPVTVPLSIIDNTVANFSRCAGIWYIDPPASPEHAILSSHLQTSLSKTLDYYRPWCGRLSYAKSKPNGNHTERYQRIWVTYNSSNDIGIPFITAKSPRQLSDFIPSTLERTTKLKAWDALNVPSKELFPATKLSISEDPDAPNVIIQYTGFLCGSTAIAIEITHCLSDAVCLSQFAQAWSLISRSMLNNFSIPTLLPIFNPQLLDSFAAANIDSSTWDPKVQNRARTLPQHRYDWYKTSPNSPWPPNIPSDLPQDEELSPSVPIPWGQWDISAPVSQRVLHFSSSEVANIYTAATSTIKTKISKHDALLAHIWTRINVARNLKEGTQTFLDMTFGLRSRLIPPLPDIFLGSPITHAAIPFPSLNLSTSSPSLGEIASTIRSTLSTFNSTAIGDLLHDAAFELAPQRLWRACLGKEHVLLTTWVYSGVHDVDFGGDVREGRKLRYVEAVMPAYDGLVVVLETPPGFEGGGGKEVKDGKEKGSWFAGGVDVTVFLESGAMERLLVDERLWSEES